VSTHFHAWCDTDDEGGPALRRSPSGTLLEDPDAWAEWLIEHEYHDISLVVESSSPFGLPPFQASRGGIRFQVRTQDQVDAACAWSDYRKEYGTSPSKEDRAQEHAAFLAGWAAAKGSLDIGGVQR
jgi:hypothetical protein